MLEKQKKGKTNAEVANHGGGEGHSTTKKKQGKVHARSPKIETKLKK